MEDSATREQGTKEFLEMHNRYDRIVDMYGQPEVGDGVKVDTSLKASLVKLKVKSPDVIGSEEGAHQQSVAKLRALLHRLYKDQAQDQLGQLCQQGAGGADGQWHEGDERGGHLTREMGAGHRKADHGYRT
jgi:hypothetical protein